MLIKLTSKMTARSQRVNILVAGVAAMSMLAVTAPASAVSMDYEKVTTTIDSRDLGTKHGLTKVYSKLQRKATLACGARNAVSLHEHKMAENCAEDLLDEFVSDVNHSKLNALHKQAKRQTRRV